MERLGTHHRRVWETIDPDGRRVVLSMPRWRHILDRHEEFDDVLYDREADVLYLAVSPNKAAVDFDASPEGHYLRYDENGALFGITIVNARLILEEEGKVTITLPEHRIEATADVLEAVATV